MIAIICDGCGVRHPQTGPNTGQVPIPEGWVQIAIEQKQRATMVQHQCPACFADTAKLLREQSKRLSPSVENAIGAPLPHERGDSRKG